MFDFTDVNTPEYISFAKFVDTETNIPREISNIDKTDIPYGFKHKVGPFRSYEQEDIISKDECDYLIWLAESKDEWLEETMNNHIVETKEAVIHDIHNSLDIIALYDRKRLTQKII